MLNDVSKRLSRSSETTEVRSQSVHMFRQISKSVVEVCKKENKEVNCKTYLRCIEHIYDATIKYAISLACIFLL